MFTQRRLQLEEVERSSLKQEEDLTSLAEKPGMMESGIPAS